MSEPIIIEIPTILGKSGARLPPLTANDRLHWTTKNEYVQLVRGTVSWRIKALRLPQADHVTVALHYRPAKGNRRDRSNLMPTQKAAVDGMVESGLVPDDNDKYVTEKIPVLHEPRKPGALWMEIFIHGET